MKLLCAISASDQSLKYRWLECAGSRLSETKSGSLSRDTSKTTSLLLSLSTQYPRHHNNKSNSSSHRCLRKCCFAQIYVSSASGGYVIRSPSTRAKEVSVC